MKKEVKEKLDRILKGADWDNIEDIDWRYISHYLILSEDFIREFKNKVYWEYISMHQVLSENFIEEFQNYVDWYFISLSQDLSKIFVIDFKEKLDIIAMLKYNKISQDFYNKLTPLSRYQLLDFS